MNIVFIGSSPIGLKQLAKSDKFSVIDVLCLKKRVTNELYKVAEELGHKIKLFDWIKDFKEIINEYDESIPFFIYQLDMLVPASLTDKYSFYNLHRGNLKTNRGPNPDIWPILLGHKTTSMSLHKINEKIDAGILIDTYDVEISGSDDTNNVKIKLEEGLPKLIESTYQFITGNIQGEEITDGDYRAWVTEEDFTIDIEKDTIEVIDRKIRCQRQYNGAILLDNGTKKYIIEVFSELPSGIDNIIEYSLDNKTIYLRENIHPICPPPPKFPVSKRI
jgi:methionyl-tRNA formyltransferase